MSELTLSRECEVVTPERMRKVLGHFASGLTVVTSWTDDGPVGFTCQSFSSLSLEPPLICLFPSRTSTSWRRIRSAGRFCVNVLQSEQEHISNQFASSGGDKFAGVAYQTSTLGNPLITGALAWIDCELYEEYDGGDHTIAVGRVVAMDPHPEAKPLVFFKGKYHRVGD